MNNKKENKNEHQDLKKKTETDIKISKSNKNTTSNIVEKKETASDSPSNSDQNVPKNNSNTEADAQLRYPATNTVSTFCKVLKGALLVTEPYAEEYFMGHERRGKAIIFNHKFFDKEDPRDGTEIDVERIKQVFGEVLNFEMEVHNDLDYVGIIKQIAELSNEDYTKCDCIAIFVLTHGKRGGEISTKDMYYPADKLWGYFTGDKCVTLAGKPKLFFISACRGRKMDHGVRLFRGKTQMDYLNKPMMTYAVPSQANNTVAGETEMDPLNKPKTYKLPSQADFLIANSTVEGYYSYRDIQNGGWFIQCLCDVITEYHETKDLMKMLTITTRKVAIDYRTISDRPEDCDITQIPSIKTMLNRDVFFRRKE